MICLAPCLRIQGALRAEDCKAQGLFLIRAFFLYSRLPPLVQRVLSLGQGSGEAFFMVGLKQKTVGLKQKKEQPIL